VPRDVPAARRKNRFDGLVKPFYRTLVKRKPGANEKNLTDGRQSAIGTEAGSRWSKAEIGRNGHGHGHDHGETLRLGCASLRVTSPRPRRDRVECGMRRADSCFEAKPCFAE
jgi:hypothetical protein